LRTHHSGAKIPCPKIPIIPINAMIVEFLGCARMRVGCGRRPGVIEMNCFKKDVQDSAFKVPD
jgi:hypothetical protein